MIFFAPGYDPATEANLAVVERLLGGLGPAAARQGAVWWGYTGAVTAPEPSPMLLPLFIQIFSFIRDEFARARSLEERRAVLLRTAELCHQAEAEIDDFFDQDPALDAGSAYLCLLHIWQRLRVWSPGAVSPLMHPDSPPPILFP